jgi:hypothetical protein
VSAGPPPTTTTSDVSVLWNLGGTPAPPGKAPRSCQRPSWTADARRPLMWRAQKLLYMRQVRDAFDHARELLSRIYTGDFGMVLTGD